MREMVDFLFVTLLVVEARPQSQVEPLSQRDGTVLVSISATMILQHSEEKVKLLERQADELRGSMKAEVGFSSDILGKKSEGKGVYEVTVENGRDTKNKLIEAQTTSDSTFARMMERESERRLNKPVLHVFDSAFPWDRPLALADEKKVFDAQVASDSAIMAGKRCYLIEYQLDAEGDSVDSEGNGKIWIDHETLLPIRTFHDFSVTNKRGKVEVKSFSDFAAIKGGIPVLLRSEIQTFPKFLFLKIGKINIVIQQSDFNLE